MIFKLLRFSCLNTEAYQGLHLLKVSRHVNLFFLVLTKTFHVDFIINTKYVKHSMKTLWLTRRIFLIIAKKLLLDCVSYSTKFDRCFVEEIKASSILKNAMPKNFSSLSVHFIEIFKNICSATVGPDKLPYLIF
jgi:hypothetical protein